MKFFLRCILTGLFLLAFSFQAHAFRCGKRIIDVGISKAKVLGLCGEPATRDVYERKSNVYIEPNVNPSGVYPYTNDARGGVYHVQTIQVEVWTYNFGRGRFMQELQFEHGVLKNIKSLGYGYR